MIELSPAAQAVITTSNCAESRIVQLNIAAALRVVAEHLGYELELDDLSGTTLHVVNIKSLLSIADELEGQ